MQETKGKLEIKQVRAKWRRFMENKEQTRTLPSQSFIEFRAKISWCSPLACIDPDF